MARGHPAGTVCMSNVTKSSCKPDTGYIRVQFTKDPDAPWYSSMGTCCIPPRVGFETICTPAVSVACNRMAYNFIGPRGNQLARGMCCGWEPASGTDVPFLER